MDVLPTQHRHHVETHLLEDLPVFHLNDLSSDQEQDPDRHVAGKHKLSEPGSIADVCLQGVFDQIIRGRPGGLMGVKCWTGLDHLDLCQSCKIVIATILLICVCVRFHSAGLIVSSNGSNDKLLSVHENNV